jgi:hypothetical protein
MLRTEVVPDPVQMWGRERNRLKELVGPVILVYRSSFAGWLMHPLSSAWVENLTNSKH